MQMRTLTRPVIMPLRTISQRMFGQFEYRSYDSLIAVYYSCYLHQKKELDQTTISASLLELTKLRQENHVKYRWGLLAT